MDFEMTDEEWNELTEAEKRRLKEEWHQAYLDECSPEQRARVEWENGS